MVNPFTAELFRNDLLAPKALSQNPILVHSSTPAPCRPPDRLARLLSIIEGAGGLHEERDAAWIRIRCQLR